jgi:hypothetical protein
MLTCRKIEGDVPGIVDFLTFPMGGSMVDIWEHVLGACILHLFFISNQQTPPRPLFASPQSIEALFTVFHSFQVRWVSLRLDSPICSAYAGNPA